MLKIKDKWIWDFWMIKNMEIYHIFYLQAPKSLSDEKLRHHNATVGHAISKDLILWEVLPDALHPGISGSWDDLAIWTGSVIEHEKKWYMYYTGANKFEHGLIQRIGLATSNDLVNWTKIPENPIMQVDETWYELLDLNSWHDQAWRDPYIFKDKNKFYAFITARVNYGPPDGRGVIACAESLDLINWKINEPVTKPGEFGQLEVPQIIKYQDNYLLIFSTAVETTSEERKRIPHKKIVHGTYCFKSNYLIGPYYEFRDDFLFGDLNGSLYSGKVIDHQNSVLRMLAFHNYSKNGEFLGYISDPFYIYI